MTVNQLMAKLRTMQKLGHGDTEVHFIAHDNCEGETQGEVRSVYPWCKTVGEKPDAGQRDANLYHSIPGEVVYLGI